MKKGRLSSFVGVLSVFALIFNPSMVLAVGSSAYENASYSAKTLGQANAVVARPQDASTALFNPAGLVELEGIQLSAGIQAVDWRIFHHNSLTGDNSKNNFKVIPIPSFWLSMNPGDLLDNRVAFGLGVNAPFGGKNHFASDTPFGEAGYVNEMEMMATTISAAVKLTDWLSIGGGAVNYYMYNYGFEFDYPNGFILGPALAPLANDSKGLTSTRGFAWGWLASLLMEPIEHHKIGVSYRSGANINVHGRARVEDLFLGIAQGFPTAPHFETATYSEVPIPANLTVGYAYEPSDKWAVELDFGWTDWSKFTDQDHTFDFTNAVLAALGTIPKNAEDTISIHLGGHYRINDRWDTYGGFAFYQEAIPKRHVDAFIPDANRYTWTTGFTYNLNERIDIDFSYFFQLWGQRNISNPETLARTGTSIDGRYTSIAHGPFLTTTIKFDFPFEGKPKDSDVALGSVAAG